MTRGVLLFFSKLNFTLFAFTSKNMWMGKEKYFGYMTFQNMISYVIMTKMEEEC